MIRPLIFPILVALAALLTNCQPQPETSPETSSATSMDDTNHASTKTDDSTSGTQIATLGAGCYWCIEAVLEQLDGVQDVESGFMGGHVPNPTYDEVCRKTTGHAEVVQVRFDPEKISYEHLLAWFWKLHDPTTLNRQGADVGPQYRSAIFYHSEAQREAAEKSKAQHAGEFADPIVTEITAASEFYTAPGEHQDFYRGNRTYGYCKAVIAPKLDKLGLEK